MTMLAKSLNYLKISRTNYSDFQAARGCILTHHNTRNAEITGLQITGMALSLEGKENLEIISNQQLLIKNDAVRV